MRIYALGDLHLSFRQKINQTDSMADAKKYLYKPMNCFGEKWEKHHIKIFNSWNKTVSENDVVLIPGDISWAMNLEEAGPDFHFLKKLSGKKILIKGNHDYWWNSISQVRQKLPDGCRALQNDSIVINGAAVTGTRGWVVPNNNEFDEHDEKVYNREVHRLKLSLDSISKKYNRLIVMFHYMPVNENHERNEMIDVLMEYDVNDCIYGHLHGEKAHQNRISGIKWGINFKLVSSDFLNFKPQLVYNYHD